MRARMLSALTGLVLLASPAAAQTTQMDSLRAEAVRSRAFIRAAETQLSKVLDLLARIAGEPIGEPVPPDTSTPPVVVPPDTVTPPPGGLLFSSDWGTALGTSDNAIMDGGRWTGGLTRGYREVVAGGSLGFPSANALRVDQVSSAAPRIDKGGLPLPAVGESRFYRWYIRVAMPDGLSDNSTHPIEAWNADPWAFEVENSPNRGIPAGHFGIWFLSPAEATPDHRWQLGADISNFIALRKHETYRIEYQWHRTGETYQHHARVYDSAGTLLYGDADFRNWDGSASMADGRDLTIGDLTGLGTLRVGNNGISGDGPYPFTHSYQAAFCIRSDTWCGPYNPER